MFPLWKAVTIPRTKLVIGMIARINETIQGNPKYAFSFFAIYDTSLPYIYNSVSKLVN